MIMADCFIILCVSHTVVIIMADCFIILLTVGLLS